MKVHDFKKRKIKIDAISLLNQMEADIDVLLYKVARLKRVIKKLSERQCGKCFRTLEESKFEANRNICMKCLNASKAHHRKKYYQINKDRLLAGMKKRREQKILTGLSGSTDR